MAFHFLTNQVPFSWYDAMGRLVRTMCAAGWQQIAFSNGVTVNNTPVLNPFPYNAFSNSLGVTTDSSLNWNTDRSWIVLQQPPIAAVSGTGGNYAGTRQIVIQHTTGDNRMWRIKYSFSGGYTVPAATGTVRTTPTVNSAINDEVYICGGGTDNAPTFDLVFFNGVEGAAHMHYVADDGVQTSGSCRSPYGFIMWGANSGGGNNCEEAFMMDPMLTGSFPDPFDPDPYIFYRDNGAVNGNFPFRTFTNNAPWTNVNGGQNGAPLTWYRKNTTAQQFLNLGALTFFNSVGGLPGVTVFPGSAGQNAHTFADDQIPVMYARAPNQFGGCGYKGLSSLVNMNSAAHSYGATLSINSNRDRFVVRDVSLPWDGSLPSI